MWVCGNDRRSVLQSLGWTQLSSAYMYTSTKYAHGHCIGKLLIQDFPIFAKETIASLFLVAMPFVTSSFLFLVVRPGATSSVIVPGSGSAHVKTTSPHQSLTLLYLTRSHL